MDMYKAIGEQCKKNCFMINMYIPSCTTKTDPTCSIILSLDITDLDVRCMFINLAYLIVP